MIRKDSSNDDDHWGVLNGFLSKVLSVQISTADFGYYSQTIKTKLVTNGSRDGTTILRINYHETP